MSLYTYMYMYTFLYVSVDWVIPEVLCVKQGGYGGRARYILKDDLKYVPLYGWYLGMVRFHTL